MPIPIARRFQFETFQRVKIEGLGWGVFVPGDYRDSVVLYRNGNFTF